MPNTKFLDSVEAEKFKKQKWPMFCGTPCNKTKIKGKNLNQNFDFFWFKKVTDKKLSVPKFLVSKKFGSPKIIWN